MLRIYVFWVDGNWYGVRSGSSGVYWPCLGNGKRGIRSREQDPVTSSLVMLMTMQQDDTRKSELEERA